MVKTHPHLSNTPIESYENVKSQILIGLDNWKLALPLDYKEARNSELIAVKCRLGWSIFGNANSDQTKLDVLHHTYHICNCLDKQDDTFHQMVKEFFCLENIGVNKMDKYLDSPDDRRSKEIMKNTTRRIGERYETGLLWKFDDFKLPESHSMARRRQDCLERRLLKDPNLAENMKKQINEYLLKGYIEKIPQSDLNHHNSRAWYLPFFPITNPNKPGKFRIV